MGAAGLGLLDSDHDADRISELDDECGLYQLTEDAQKKAMEAGATERDSWRIRYSLIANSRDPDACKITRDFLESSGALTRLIETWKRKALGPPNPDDYICNDPRYTLVLIGLGAMSNGCVLDEEFLEIMRRVFTECGFMRDSLKQIDTVYYHCSLDFVFRH